MDFETFVNQAWSEHADNAALVAERLASAGELLEVEEQIPAIIQLITHIYGDHLGQWDDGLKLLEDVGSRNEPREGSEGSLALKRAKAVFLLAADRLDSVDDFSLSDQIRILSSACGALAGQGNFDRGSRFFEIALNKVKPSLPKSDPAYRSLAVTANILARGLENKHDRSFDETELMVTAARAARKYWEIAGTWLEVARAEYRMAMTYLETGDSESALSHAVLFKEICESHRASPDETFWAHEALARIEFRRGDVQGYASAVDQAALTIEKMDAGARKWCAASFENIKNLPVVEH